MFYTNLIIWKSMSSLWFELHKVVVTKKIKKSEHRPTLFEKVSQLGLVSLFPAIHRPLAPGPIFKFAIFPKQLVLLALPTVCPTPARIRSPPYKAQKNPNLFSVKISVFFFFFFGTEPPNSSLVLLLFFISLTSCPNIASITSSIFSIQFFL